VYSNTYWLRGLAGGGPPRFIRITGAEIADVNDVYEITYEEDDTRPCWRKVSLGTTTRQIGVTFRVEHQAWFICTTFNNFYCLDSTSPLPPTEGWFGRRIAEPLDNLSA
jgi:hypothetical protein